MYLQIRFVPRIKSAESLIFRGVRKIAKSDYQLLRPSAWNTSASTGQIFKKFWVFFENL